MSGTWNARLMHQLGGWSLLAADGFQGQGCVRLSHAWPSFALGLGPSTGYAMGSLAVSLSEWEALYPYMLDTNAFTNHIGGGAIPGVVGIPPPGVVPASIYDPYLTAEKVVLWRVEDVGIFGPNVDGQQTWSTAPRASIIQIQDPPDVLSVDYPEAYRAWIASADGSWHTHQVGTGRERVLTRYTLPSYVGPDRAPVVDSITPLVGGVVGFALWYSYTWIDDEGNESLPSPPAAVAYEWGRAPSEVALSGILAGPTGTVARRAYRGSTYYATATPRFDEMHLCGEIADNTTTTLTDDAGADDPSVNPPGPAAEANSLELIGGPEISYVFYAPEFEDYTAEQVNMALTFQAFGGINRKILAWLKAFRPEVFED